MGKYMEMYGKTWRIHWENAWETHGAGGLVVKTHCVPSLKALGHPNPMLEEMSEKGCEMSEMSLGLYHL